MPSSRRMERPQGVEMEESGRGGKRRIRDKKSKANYEPEEETKMGDDQHEEMDEENTNLMNNDWEDDCADKTRLHEEHLCCFASGIAFACISVAFHLAWLCFSATRPSLLSIGLMGNLLQKSIGLRETSGCEKDLQRISCQSQKKGLESDDEVIKQRCKILARATISEEVMKKLEVMKIPGVTTSCSLLAGWSSKIPL